MIVSHETDFSLENAATATDKNRLDCIHFSFNREDVEVKIAHIDSLT